MPKAKKIKLRIYIAGAGGMLGEAFKRVFGRDNELICSDIDVNEPWLNYCDFRDLISYRKSVLEASPDFLFHIGALTDLEYCERNITNCFMTNTFGVRNACSISAELRIPILYISTAGIFDGGKDTYDDLDKPLPLSNYGKSKYQGEKIVKESLKDHLIIRPGWMMGGGPKKDKKFVNKIYKKIQSGEKKLYIVKDKLGSPTYTYDLAENILLLIKNKIWGTYNMTCAGKTSRVEVAKEILLALNLQEKIEIEEVGSSYFSKEYFAPRPSSERLINRKLEEYDLNIMRDWRTCLHEYINDHFLRKQYLNKRNHSSKYN